MTRRSAWLPSLLSVLTLACTDTAPDARRAWLWTTLRDDARPYIERDPVLAAARFQMMDSHPYAFLRGTLGQFQRDALEGGPAFGPSAFGRGAAAEVLLVGDPHLENLGTFRAADDTLRFDFNDFDAATFGPYPLDVRRMALSVALALRVLDVESPEAAVAAVAEGYVAEIAAEAAGEPPFVADAAHTDDAGEIVAWLLGKAREEGDAAEPLAEDSELVDARRRLRRGELDDRTSGVVTRALTNPSEAEAHLVAAALADYGPQVGLRGGAARPLDVARRLGAGIASYASLRFYVLLSGPTADPEDDLLLEMKEVPPMRVSPARATRRRPFAGDAERVVDATRALQTDAGNDPWLGVARVGPQAFRIRERTGFQKGLDLDKLDERLTSGKWTPADVVDLAATAGRLLARGHARARDRRGHPGLAAIRDDLAGRETGFVNETRRFALDYADVVLDDAATFHGLMEAHGPLLGARP
jgi:uncharacterized protein (DUF2252 family)